MLDRLQSTDTLGLADRTADTERVMARAPHPRAERGAASVRVLEPAHRPSHHDNPHEAGIGQLLLSRSRVTPPPLREDTLVQLDGTLAWNT